MKTTTIGVFPDKQQAEKAIEELKGSGISDGDISCVYRESDGSVVDSESGEKVGSGVMKGATAGAAIGAIAGLVVATGVLPGLGTLFVAGPLATALGLTGATATTVAGAATGAVAGGLVGALKELGVNDVDAELYEDHVEKGEVLVVSRSDKEGAVEVFNNNNAMEIREYVLS
jgi:hypothetical protein